MTLRPWKILKSSYIIDSPWMKLRADACETPEGAVIDPFYVMESNDWVHIVAKNDAREILLCKQYRHGAQVIAPEIPCGVMDKPGESPVETARRELLEETGCSGELFEFKGKLLPNPARQSNWIQNVLVTGVKKVAEPVEDETEVIESWFASVDEVATLIRSGELKQATHIASLLVVLPELASKL